MATHERVFRWQSKEMIAYVLLLVEISEVRKILRERKGRLKKRRIFFPA